MRLGDALELVRERVDVEPTKLYSKIGVRSFGRGIFHYEPRPGDELGKLRFFALRPKELVLSNIKAWEGAIAVSSDDDAGLVASNRFLTYQPRLPAKVDVRYVRFLLLSDQGLAHIQKASPGSADRNRTLGIKAFEDINLPLPGLRRQVAIANELEKLERQLASWRDDMERTSELHDELMESALHRTFQSAARNEVR